MGMIWFAQIGAKNFTLQWGSLVERPMVDRVMSTSTWPVPYYQRIFKAYPIRGNPIAKQKMPSSLISDFYSFQNNILEKKDKMSLLLSDIDIDDTNWYQAKDFLRGSFRGR